MKISNCILFALICSLFISFGFTLSNYVHVPFSTIGDFFLNTGHFAIIAVANFVLCYLLAVNKYVFAVVFPILVGLSGIIAFFVYSQNLTFTTSILDASLHNDFRTSFDLISWPFVTFFLSSLTASLIAVFYRFKVIRFRLKWIEIGLILSLGYVIVHFNNTHNRTVMQRLPYSICYVNYMYWLQHKSYNLPRKEVGIDAVSEGDSITVVLVIGESCRADHLEINGYERNTNKELKKLDVISYPHILSEWTQTNLSLPHFLTRSDSSNHAPALEEKSFISIFNRCGFKTSWIANQEPAPNYFPFVKEAQSVIYVNPANSVYAFNRKWLDTDVFGKLGDLLNLRERKKLIVIHTIGSHWWYNDHFTDSATMFRPILETKLISGNSKKEMINSYDNTIVYTDLFLSRLIRKLFPYNACMIYLSDHGESLGEGGKWLHAQGNDAEKNPACIIWASEKYKKSYPDIFSNITQNKDKRWRTEFLFSSILSMANIRTDCKNGSLDITHK